MKFLVEEEKNTHYIRIVIIIWLSNINTNDRLVSLYSADLFKDSAVVINNVLMLNLWKNCYATHKAQKEIHVHYIRYKRFLYYIQIPCDNNR